MIPSSNNIAKDNLLALSLEKSNFRKFTVEKETGKLIKVNGAIEWIIRLIKNIFTAGGEDRKVHDIYQKNMIALGKTPLSDREFTVSKLKANLLSQKIDDLINKPKVEVVDESPIEEEVIEDPKEIQGLPNEDESLADAFASIVAELAEKTRQEEKAAEEAEVLRLNEQLSELDITQSSGDSTLNALLDTLEAKKPLTSVDFKPGPLEVPNWLVDRIIDADNQMEFLVNVANLAFMYSVHEDLPISSDKVGKLNKVIEKAMTENSELKINPIVYELGSLTEAEVEQKMEAFIKKWYNEPPKFPPFALAAMKAAFIMDATMDSLRSTIKSEIEEQAAITELYSHNCQQGNGIFLRLLENERMNKSDAEKTEYRQQAVTKFRQDTEQLAHKVQSKLNI